MLWATSDLKCTLCKLDDDGKTTICLSLENDLQLQQCLWRFGNKVGPARAASPSTSGGGSDINKVHNCVSNVYNSLKKMKSNILQPMKNKFIKSLSNSFIQSGRILLAFKGPRFKWSIGKLSKSSESLSRKLPLIFFLLVLPHSCGVQSSHDLGRNL